MGGCLLVAGRRLGGRAPAAAAALSAGVVPGLLHEPDGSRALRRQLTALRAALPG